MASRSAPLVAGAVAAVSIALLSYALYPVRPAAPEGAREGGRHPASPAPDPQPSPVPSPIPVPPVQPPPAVRPVAGGGQWAAVVHAGDACLTWVEAGIDNLGKRQQAVLTLGAAVVLVWTGVGWLGPLLFKWLGGSPLALACGVVGFAARVAVGERAPPPPPVATPVAAPQSTVAVVAATPLHTPSRRHRSGGASPRPGEASTPKPTLQVVTPQPAPPPLSRASD